MDDLLPLVDLPELEAGEEFDSSVFPAVVDEALSDLDFFFRFLPSTVVIVVAMTVMMRSGDENFILVYSYSIFYMQRLKRL